VAAGRRGGKRWRILWLCLVFAISAACLSYFATRLPYSFLRELAAQPRKSDWTWTALGEIRCYTFHDSSDRVLSRIKAELQQDGWHVASEDDELTAFERKTPTGGDQRAVFDSNEYRVWKGPNGSEPATCALWLDYQPSWAELQVAKIRSSLGRSEALAPFLERPYRDEVGCQIIPHDLGDKIGLDLVWKNYSKDPMTVRPGQCRYNEYVPEQKLPETIELAPRQRVITHLTISKLAGMEREQETLTYDFHNHGSIWGNGNRTFGEELSPVCVVRKMNTGAQISIHNAGKGGRKPRQIEIAEIGVWDKYEPVLYVDKPVKLEPDQTTSFDFPVAATCDISALIFNVKYRFVGNSEWKTVRTKSPYD
jgi:hypothetical protein